MTKLLRCTTAAALAALASSPAWAEERCDNVGSPGSSRSESAKVCDQTLAQDGTTSDEARYGAGSASAEPGGRGPASIEQQAGYGAGIADPGYYVNDPSESQFLLDTWTSGGA